MMAEAESRLPYARYFDDSDVWLAIFSLLEVDDVLQLRQVSRLFYELTHRTAVWLALYHRQEPTLPLFFPPTSNSIGRFLKFRTNWTSPHPFPVEAPRELSISRRQNKVADLRIVELGDGSSWLVVIILPRIFRGKPWRNGKGELHHSNFVFVQAIPFDTIDAPLHQEKKSGDPKWEFGKWTVVDGLPGHATCWVFDEDEDSPYILSLICIDGFIYTYSLSPIEGWICMIKTPLTMVPHDRIGFVASSGCRAIVVINVWNLPTKELVNSPGTTIALMDLRSEEGKITLLHNPNGKRREHLGLCAARFSRTHVAVFCRVLFGGWSCREVLIYLLQHLTQDIIEPAAHSLLPKGTNNFVFSHITTAELTFTILLTYSQPMRMRPQYHNTQPDEPELTHRGFGDEEFSPTHTAFTFDFDPSTAKATFVEEPEIQDQIVYQDHFCIPQLSNSGRTLLHWGIDGEIKCEHLGLGSETKSSILLKGSTFLKRGSFRGNIVLAMDDRKGLVAWWWAAHPRSSLTMVKYGHCDGLC